VVDRQTLTLVAAVALALSPAVPTSHAPWVAAQAPATSPADVPSTPSARLYEREPYDMLILNDPARTTFKLVPLDLEGRRLPAKPSPTSLVRVQLFDDPKVKYDVAWRDIAEIRLYEQELLDETARLVRDGEFAAAFDYVLYFRRERPQWPIDDVERKLLFAEASQAFETKQFERAWLRSLRLLELGDGSPEFADLLARTTEAVARQAIEAERPTAARLAVERFLQKYARHAAATSLRELLNRAAAEHAEAAEQALAAGQYNEAQAEAQAAAMLTAPDDPMQALYRRTVEAHPTAVVGVVERARADGRETHETLIADAWAERRTARLRRRPLLPPIVTVGEAERLNYGDSGNELKPSDDGSGSYRLHMGEDGPTAAEVAARFTDAMQPADGSFASVEVTPLDRRTLELRPTRPHPKFEAWVAAVVDGPAARRTISSPHPPFESMRAADTVRYLRNGTSDRGDAPMEIVERTFRDEERAVTALLAGKIDVVDRLAPWQVGTLRGRKDVNLVRYAASSVHLLLFNGKRPLLQSAEFRRAVAYAIDRESILRNHLRPEHDDLGSQPNEGLFAIGRTPADPTGYAYNLATKRRPYDPAQSLVLAALARRMTGDAKSGTTLQPFTLLHPNTATAATVCKRIATYLAAVGIVVVPRAAAHDRAPVAADEADLTYVALSSIEPLIDAPRRFGPGGLINLPSPSLRAAVVRLSKAESFAPARNALYEMQRVVHDETLLVPLWQLSEYAAHRGRVAIGAADRPPVVLYQDVDVWRIVPRFSPPLP
jgi:hypothetical protein